MDVIMIFDLTSTSFKLKYLECKEEASAVSVPPVEWD